MGSPSPRSRRVRMYRTGSSASTSTKRWWSFTGVAVGHAARGQPERARVRQRCGSSWWSDRPRRLVGSAAVAHPTDLSSGASARERRVGQLYSRPSNGRGEGPRSAPPDMPKARNPLRSSIGVRRHLARLCGVAAVSVGLFAGISATAVADGPGPVRAEVFCGGSNELLYRFRPAACDFHQRGVLISSQVGYTLTRRLHWAHWGPRRATASGEIDFPMEGWSPVRIHLTDPRTGCGHTMFTMATLHVPGRGSGGTKIPLDRCPAAAE